MAEFLITAPDGKKYRVTGDNAEGAHAALVKSLGGNAQQSQETGLTDDERASLSDALKPKDPGAIRAALGGIAQGATFGFADEAMAGILSALPNITYEQAKRYLDAGLKRNRETHPVASIAGELAGAVAVPGAGGAGLVARATSPAARIGAGVVSGAASGGLYGFGTGENGFENRFDNALSGALVGGAVGAAVPAAGALVRTVAKNRAARRVVEDAARGAPSSDELRAAGNALYQQIDDAGVQIRPESFSRMRSGLLDDLRANTGFDELPGPGSLTPNTGRVVQIMDEAGARMAQEPTAALPFRSLDQMRRQAGAAAGNVTNRTDQAAGSQVIRNLDDFVQNLGPDDVVAGDIEALQSAIPKAREIWQRMSKSQKIDDAIEASSDYLSGGSSGIRNQFKNLLRNQKAMRGFTDAEKTAMRQVVNGGPLEQIVNLLGGGMAQLGSIAAGGAMGGIPGAALGAAAAAGQRKLSEGMTLRAAERARAAIASGALNLPGPLNALAIAGQKPEQLTNALAFGANALLAPSVLQGQR